MNASFVTLVMKKARSTGMPPTEFQSALRLRWFDAGTRYAGVAAGERASFASVWVKVAPREIWPTFSSSGSVYVPVSVIRFLGDSASGPPTAVAGVSDA